MKQAAVKTNLLLEEVVLSIQEINKNIVINTKPYLTPKEVCSFLSFSRKSFDRLVNDGTIPIHRIGKGRIYVRRADIDLIFQS